MKLIIDETEFNIFQKEVPDEVVGYTFYSLSGQSYGFYKVGESGYPRANYKIMLELNGKKLELDRNQKVYKLDDGSYFVGNIIK